MQLRRGIAVVILLFGLIQFTRTAAILNAPLTLFKGRLIFRYGDASISFVWALALIWAAVHLWNKSGMKRVFWVCIGFMFYSVARIFLYARADYDRQRLPFLMVLVGCAFIGLLIFRFLSNGEQGMEK